MGLIRPMTSSGSLVAYAGEQSGCVSQKSEAPARTFRSKPSASIFTISGNGALDAAMMALRVLTGTEIRGESASSEAGTKELLSSRWEIANGSLPGPFGSARVDPSDLVAAVKQDLDMDFEVILRLNEPVLRVGKIQNGFSGP